MIMTVQNHVNDLTLVTLHKRPYGNDYINGPTLVTLQ